MNPLVSLAKLAVEAYIKNKKIIEAPRDLPEQFLKRKSGVFVTIKKNGKLRGCVGTYLPTRINIAQEIIYNAIAAATQDYRFEPIKNQELPELSYVVSILSYPEPIKNKKELNPKKYGIVVRTVPLLYPNQEISLKELKEGIVSKTGLLLPNIEGVNTVEKQISLACQKGGIDEKKEKIFIYKFTTEQYF